MRATRLVGWTVLSGVIFAPITFIGQGSGSGATVSTTCPSADTNSNLPTPVLNAVDAKAGEVSGSVKKGSTGKVQICADDGTMLGSQPVDTSGAFKVEKLTALTAGKTIKAQFIDNSDPSKFGPFSSIVIGTCSELAPASGTAPTLTIVSETANTVTYSGTVKGVTKGNIQICVNDGPKATGISIGPDKTGSNGTFSGKGLTVNAGDKVVAQQVIDGNPPTYGPLSSEVDMVVQPASTGDQNKAVAVLIGGVEYSGYSAQSQTTNGFLNVFYRGPISAHGLSGWARIRLTSSPQQATNGVVSVLTDPTGITTHDYSNVGQALDYVFGPSWRLAAGWSLIADLGATTPLSSQNTPVVLTAPPPNTVECNELVSRFSAANGYSPFLTLNTAASPTTCLAGGYTNVAFANLDRSSFLLKYGAGFRTSYPFRFGQCNNASGGCSPAYAALDAIVGQDASVTGGQLHRFVFKLDGILPIPTGSSSWLYLFGSSYVRLQRNAILPPLLLNSPTTTVTVPSPTVIVLPLRQPDRDYYRLGVGLNINQLWCKTFGTGCSSGSQSADNTGSGSTAGGGSKPKTQ